MHVGDDEYGSPIYDYKWQVSEQLQNDRHHTQIAVALNRTVVNDLYKRIGRYELIYNFETSKYNSIVNNLQSLKSKSDTYNPPQIAQLVLHKADITLHNDHMHIKQTLLIAAEVLI